MRATWKGAVSFGLVTIPVQLFAATREHDVPLHQVHHKDGSRVRMRRFCEEENKEVPYAEIARGYQAPDGTTVTLSEDDLAELPVPSKKTIEVLAFVDAAEIDPLMYSRAYYVGVTERAAHKPYVLLRAALEESGQVAVTKIALRSRESLAVLRVHERTLVLHTCLWPDEVRDAGEVAPADEVTVRPQELKMARSLMETLSEGFELSAVHDEYTAALQQVVEARLEGVEPPHARPTRAGGGEVIDLMAALENSVQAAKGETADEGAGRGAGRTAKKASKSVRKKTGSSKDAAGAGTSAGKAAKKPAAKKAAAKKTAAKKAAAKKTGGASARGERKSTGQGATRPRKSA